MSITLPLSSKSTHRNYMNHMIHMIFHLLLSVGYHYSPLALSFPAFYIHFIRVSTRDSISENFPIQKFWRRFFNLPLPPRRRSVMVGVGTKQNDQHGFSWNFTALSIWVQIERIFYRLKIHEFPVVLRSWKLDIYNQETFMSNGFF